MDLHHLRRDEIFMKFIVIFLCFVCSAEAQGWRYNHHGTKRVLKTILVEQHGRGNFTSIQAAIDSVPHNHPHWTCIRVAAGVYREKVTINKPYLVLKGSGKEKTKVVYNDNPNMQLSSTLVVVADNFVAKGISFINSRNLAEYGGNTNNRQAAAAGYIMGDKLSFHRCGFYGVQDTLWDVQGRHYYHRTTIAGSVDFIFGAGQSIFEVGWTTRVHHSTRERISIRTKWICVQRMQHSRRRPCVPRTALGDVCKGSVLQYHHVRHRCATGLGCLVQYFVEDKCSGPGANTSKRVPWEKKLSAQEIQKLTSLNFINADKWIHAQPINFK